MVSGAFVASVGCTVVGPSVASVGFVGSGPSVVSGLDGSPMQQSCHLPHHVLPVEKSLRQLLLPQVKPSAHSLSLLQSPSPKLQGPLYLQHLRTLNQSVPSHPVPVSGTLSGAKQQHIARAVGTMMSLLENIG